MAYSVPDLPYDYNALEPHIDAQTMRIHHDKHHQAYVDKANAALEGTEWADKPVEDGLKNLWSLPAEKQGPVRTMPVAMPTTRLFGRCLAPLVGERPVASWGRPSTRAFEQLRRPQKAAQ